MTILKKRVESEKEYLSNRKNFPNWKYYNVNCQYCKAEIIRTWAYAKRATCEKCRICKKLCDIV